MYFFRTFLFVILTGILFFAPVASAATVLQLSPRSVSVKAGEKFTLTVGAYPTENTNYTVKMVAEFSPDILSVYSWDYADDWLPLRKSGYDGLDNNAGVLTRTAGYPEGFDGPKTFGTITFVAKKDGVASVRVGAQSLVLDNTNTNVVALGPPVSVTVSAVEAIQPEVPVVPPSSVPTPPVTPVEPKQPASVPKPVETTPVTESEASSILETPEPWEEVSEEIFFEESPDVVDSQLRLNHDMVDFSTDLVAVSVVDNLGETPVDVVLDYSILNSAQIEQYQERTESLVVANQEFFLKEFFGLSLDSGSYTLIVSVLQNGQVVDVQQKTFEVRFSPVLIQEEAPQMSWALGTALGFFFFFLIAILVAVFHKIHRHSWIPHRLHR